MPKTRQRRPDCRPLGDLRPGERPSERRPVVNQSHVPVMVDEVLHYLNPQPGAVVADCTLGAGGHAEAILRASGGRARLIGLDRDPMALQWAADRLEEFGGAVTLRQARFDTLPDVLASLGLQTLDGILLDLGMSSMQIDDPARGFAFRQDGPLDMRMDSTAELSAFDVVNTYAPAELERVLRTYGQERLARRISRDIVEARRRSPVRTTGELARIVEEAYPRRRSGSTHPARRTFQAIRIEVNDELGCLERLLARAGELLNPGGRIVVLSYHSLEDAMTKRVLASQAPVPPPLPGLPPPDTGATLRILTRSAVLPSTTETERNPRASSARLRAAERI